MTLFNLGIIEFVRKVGFVVATRFDTQAQAIDLSVIDHIGRVKLEEVVLCCSIKANQPPCQCYGRHRGFIGRSAFAFEVEIKGHSDDAEPSWCLS